MKVVRILVFEGEPKNVLHQLAHSQPDGVKEFGYPGSPGDVAMTLLTIRPEDLAQAGEQVDLLRGHILKAVDWETRERD